MATFSLCIHAEICQAQPTAMLQLLLIVSMGIPVMYPTTVKSLASADSTVSAHPSGFLLSAVSTHVHVRSKCPLALHEEIFEHTHP